MSYEPKIIEKPEQIVLSIRTRTAVGDLPQVMGRCFGSITQYLGELGEQPAGAPFVGYYNMDMEALDVEIGFPVNRPLAGKGEIQSGSIAGGKQASCLHVGAYKDIEPAYNALMAFIRESGYEASGLAYEFYLNDPGETPEEALETEVVFPLKDG
ncbi:MAG: GyrI-like domain-containing protein [Anaerolineales bacterium]|jgi:effector-binding domain-containing protein